MLKLTIPALALMICTSACAATSVSPGDNIPEKPLSLTTKQKELVNQGQSFSLEFLDRIETEAAGKEDYIISPLSMQILLGMILNAAQGPTAAEISNVLGYGADGVQEVNDFCKAMLTQLPGVDRKTKLSMANAIFVDKGYELLKPYVKTVGDYYGAEVSNLDFADTKPSTDHINQWCSRNTNGLIDKVLDEVSTDMLCYLLNALYFKGEWTDKFYATFTKEEPFKVDGKEVAKVPMMRTEKEYLYGQNELFQAVRLPYGNGSFSMTVLLPNGKHTTAEVTKWLKLNGTKSLLGYDRNVDLWLPRFQIKYHILLNDILSDMGMPLSFNSNADFSLMSPDALKLSFVQQDAIIKVDEEGAEAAAVSSAGMEKATAIPVEPPVEFHADHPFVFLITERNSGAILFAGRYSAKK